MMSLLRSLPKALNGASKTLSHSVPAVFYHPNVNISVIVPIVVHHTVLSYIVESYT